MKARSKAQFLVARYANSCTTHENLMLLHCLGSRDTCRDGPSPSCVLDCVFHEVIKPFCLCCARIVYPDRPFLTKTAFSALLWPGKCHLLCAWHDGLERVWFVRVHNWVPPVLGMCCTSCASLGAFRSEVALSKCDMWSFAQLFTKLQEDGATTQLCQELDSYSFGVVRTSMCCKGD